MSAYLVDSGNEHAMSLMKKMEDAGQSAFIVCTREEFQAYQFGAIFKLPEKNKSRGRQKCLTV